LRHAADALARACELDADAFSARYHLGLALLRLGDLDDAHTELSRAVALNKEQPLAFYHLGLTLSRLRRYTDAVGAYRQAVSLDGEMSSAYYQWANAEMRLGNRDAGQALLAKFRSVKARKRVRQAVARARQGKADRAEQLLQRALEMDRENSGAVHVLALLAFAEGRMEDTARYARQYVELRPGADDMQVILGAALRRLGDAKGAIEALALALEGGAAYPEAWFELGQAHSLMDSLAEAASAFQSATDADPTFYQAAHRLGVALVEAGEPEAAVAAHRACIAHYPNDSDASEDILYGGNVPRLVRSAAVDPSLRACWAELSIALRQAGDDEGANVAAKRAEASDTDGSPK
jgi:tetratricopeptide (TPR) repeat protein